MTIELSPIRKCILLNFEKKCFVFDKDATHIACVGNSACKWKYCSTKFFESKMNSSFILHVTYANSVHFLYLVWYFKLEIIVSSLNGIGISKWYVGKLKNK